MEAALVSGHCAAMTGDLSMLAVERAGFHSRQREFVILPEIISEDPFAPAYRAGDVQWQAILNGVTAALQEAERNGISQANAAMVARKGDRAAKRLLEATGTGRDLGLDDLWAARAISAAGNYGEMFDRDLGALSPLRLDRRGPNGSPSGPATNQ
jgi:general L-amino acid transport system substrate-binding protein